MTTISVSLRGIADTEPALGWAGAHTMMIDRPESASEGRGLGFNGGQLLALAIGGCFCNDIRYVAPLTRPPQRGRCRASRKCARSERADDGLLAGGTAMALLLVTLGVLVFMVVHLVPMRPRWRDALVAPLGEGPYKAAFSILSLAGLIGAIWAYRYTPHVALWGSPMALRALTSMLMLASVLLFAVAKAPWGKRIARHPMLWGIALWGIAHLLSNGDLAGLILFGGMAVFGLVWQGLTDRRDAEADAQDFAEIQRTTSLIPFARWGARSDPMTLRPVLIGLVVYIVLIVVHPWLFGAPVAM